MTNKNQVVILIIVILLISVSPKVLSEESTIKITTIDTLLTQMQGVEVSEKPKQKKDTFSHQLGLSKVNLGYEFDDNHAFASRTVPFFTKSHSLKKLKKAEALEAQRANHFNKQNHLKNVINQFYFVWGIGKKIDLIKAYKRQTRKASSTSPLAYTLRHLEIEFQKQRKVEEIKLRIMLELRASQNVIIAPKVPAVPLTTVDLGKYTINDVDNTIEYELILEELKVASANFQVASHMFSPDITIGADFLDSFTSKSRIAPRFGIDFPILSSKEVERVRRIKKETIKQHNKFEIKKEVLLTKILINVYELNAAAAHIESDLRYYPKAERKRRQLITTLPNPDSEINLKERLHQELDTITYYIDYHSRRSELKHRFQKPTHP